MTKSNKIKKDNVSIGNTGEFYVAAELTRRNFSVSLLRSNTSNYDILAIENTSGRQVAIQVKTSTLCGKSWVLRKHKDYQETIECFYYVFVRIVNQNNPEYHIVPSSIVEKYISEHGNEWKTQTRRFSDKKNEYLNNWEILSKN